MKYILTSTTFEGSIIYGYDYNGLLSYFEVSAVLSREQYEAVLKNLQYALQEETFRSWAAKYKYKIAMLPPDLSFDAFYLPYPVKRNKYDAKKMWELYPDDERQRILVNLRAYLRYCARNANWYNPLYPDTYLRKHTKDEWDKS